jgi:hypothetical protein
MGEELPRGNAVPVTGSGAAVAAGAEAAARAAAAAATAAVAVVAAETRAIPRRRRRGGGGEDEEEEARQLKRVTKARASSVLQSGHVCLVPAGPKPAGAALLWLRRRLERKT